MSKASQETRATNTVSLAESRLGNPEPQIELRFAEGTSPRQVSAALHRLAAEIELATPEQERWVVQMESFYGARGRVWLELAEGTEEEAERGMGVLKRLG